MSAGLQQQLEAGWSRCCRQAGCGVHPGPTHGAAVPRLGLPSRAGCCLPVAHLPCLGPQPHVCDGRGAAGGAARCAEPQHSSRASARCY
jgi:hypothetical protein